MGTQTTGHLPNPFYGIEVWAVRGQEIKTEHMTVFPQPRFKIFGVMITGVVQDDDDLASVSKVSQELFQERLERGGVERLLLPRDQPPIADPHRPENGDTLACGSVLKNRIEVFGRHPHGAT